MKRDEISAERLAELNAGAEARVLTECLAVDFAALLAHACPEADGRAIIAGDGITKRMAQAAAALPRNALAKLAQHRSDTVRGWAAFATAADAGDFYTALPQMLPFADDPHFGPREWAWLALRPAFATALAQDPARSFAALRPLTQSPSANLRRFASELTRPRGVWCSHLPSLKADPSIGFALLEQLKADPSRYVQDSVANWLNDAGKSRPDALQTLLARWHQDQNPATAYICKRAARSLK